MDFFPVVCALLGFVLIGPSDANVVTLNSTSSHKWGKRSNFYATCNGPCGEVNVTVLSGNPKLFLAQDSIPILQWNGGDSGSIGCENCLQKVINVTLINASSFGLSVLTTKSSDIVQVYGANLKDIKERNYPSKTVNIGTLTHKKDRIIKFTCLGDCKEVFVYATSDSKYTQWFLNKNTPSPGTGSGGMCFSCSCYKTAYSGKKTNQCQFQSLDSSTFYVVVVGYGVQNNIKLTVEALNLDLGLESKIPFPPKPLNLTSSRVGERKNFHVTCNGPCSQVTVFAKYGKPKLFWAKEAIPFLQWSGGSVGCTNCLQKKFNVSFTNSSSFGISVLKTKSRDRVIIYGANLKDINERNYPSKILKSNSSRVEVRKNYNITCKGPCSQVNVIGVSGNPRLYFAQNSIPILQWTGGWGGSIRCNNCLSEDSFFSLTNSSSFGLTVVTTTSSDIVKVEATNLDDIDEIIFPSITVDIGHLAKWGAKTYKFSCNGPCKQVSVDATPASGNRPYLFAAKQKPDSRTGGLCYNCFCVKAPWGDNPCISHSFTNASEFHIQVFTWYKIYAKLWVEASNLKGLI